MQPADYLKQLSLFADLSAEEIMDVLRMARVVSFAPGDVLCTRGSASDCLFVLEAGEAVVRVRDEKGGTVELSRIGPGEVIGELGLVDGQPRSADVVALSALRAYRIDRSEFDAMRRALHPAAFKMLRRIALTVSERLREINSTISDQLVGGTSARSLPPARSSRVHDAPTRSSRVHDAPARSSRVHDAPARSSRVHDAPARSSRVHDTPARSSVVHEPPKPAEPEERGLLRSVLSRLSAMSFK